MKPHVLLFTVACACGMMPVMAATNTPVRIRVLTYNIASGAGMKLDMDRTARVITAERPDFVALQEVDKLTRRHPLDQAAALARLTGLHFAYGKAMDHAGGQYGEAVLSRFPIIAEKNHLLPAPAGFEPRAALAVDVRLGAAGPLVRFVGTHLDHVADPTVRNAQARQLNELFARDDAPPTILAGDFNAQPDHEAYRLLAARWTDATITAPQGTWPAKNPNQKIDFIWFRPAKRFRVVEAKVVDEREASDHRPVLAVLEHVAE